MSGPATAAVREGSGLRLGLSANYFAPDPQRRVYPHSRLLYVEEHLAAWVASTGALVYGVPSPEARGGRALADYVADLDGLVLSGGADVSPRSYGEEPIRAEWEGQYDRDRYEIELIERFLDAGKPILGVCRGHQVLNVALGGTLYQDVREQGASEREHRSQERYHRNLHELELVQGSGLAALYPGQERVLVNSIHHQAVRDVARDLLVEARSVDDGVVEAFRLEGSAVGGDRYAVGIQWHPEFFGLLEGEPLLDNGPILAEFTAAAEARG